MEEEIRDSLLQRNILKKSQQNIEFEILDTLRYDPMFTNITRSSVDNRYSVTTYNPALDVRSPVKLTIDQIRNCAIFEDQVTLVDTAEEVLKIAKRNMLLLDWHFERLVASSNIFGYKIQLTLDELMKAIWGSIITLELNTTKKLSNEDLVSFLLKNQTKKSYKIRVLLEKSNDIPIIQAIPLEQTTLKAPQSISKYFINTLLGGFLENKEIEWGIYLDKRPIEPTLFTTLKTTNRGCYNEARKILTSKIDKHPTGYKKNEILLLNTDEDIMEGSITSVIFEKDGRFFTPPISTGCLFSIMRYYLIKKCFVTEQIISKDKLQEYQSIYICNGVMGCVKSEFITCI